MKKLFFPRGATFWLLFLMICAATSPSPVDAQTPAHTFAIGEQSFLLDGKPMLIRCGEIHFARVPREYWTHRLKMAKAMGLNAVCVYLFWNLHEWKESRYDWSGMADAAEFCRLAQKEGLWVLLRPGPYACAEWEMGGLPWWLLKRDGMNLRSKDASFLAPATRFLKEVGRVLGPQQITKGGPILMVQVENEYGSYGRDAEYMGALRQALVDGGFDVPLFACNPPGAIGNGFREDLFQVVNFGSNPKGAFETLRKFQKTGPLMNGEFYPAWFDMWGRKHRTGDVDKYIADLDYMLQNNHSFSIYMAHGGTTFGLWSGADRPFSPDTSSYDYDAPISEAGWVTEKFTRTRELFAKHLLPGETLPAPPAANPVIEIPAFSLGETAPILQNLPKSIVDAQPRTMEFYDQSRGVIVYAATLPAGAAATLSTREAHDFAWVFLNGKQVGLFDRRSRRYSLELPARTIPSRLEIVVEAVGRVNFGREVFDRKGLIGPVQLKAGEGAATDLTGWQVSSLPLDSAQLAALKYRTVPALAAATAPTTGPAFWRGSFNLARTGDTFLDVRSWGKGVLWVNGHCLGRFWNIGPTQTMYVPGPWLRAGRNEVVVLDMIGPKNPRLAGLAQPILDEVRLDLDFARRTRAGGTFNAGNRTPATAGAFSADVQWQESRFAMPQTGRYLALEALSSLNGQAFAAIAELDVLGTGGEVLSKAKWKILWVSSEELSAESGQAENILDGQPNSHWHTQYGATQPSYPHRLVIDLGDTQTLSGIRYLPRAGDANIPGRIKDYRVYVADTPFGLTPSP